MQIGLDIGRQYVKMVVVEKTRDGLKLLNVDSKLIPEKNKPFDPENIDAHLIVMAVKELINQMSLKPKHLRNLTTGISGSNISIKQITTMDMSTDELKASMMFEARKHMPMDGTDAVIDYQVLGPNRFETDKIDVILVACTNGVRTSHQKLLKDIGLKADIIDSEPIAIMNAFLQSHQSSEEGAVILLDIGAVSTSLIVWGEQDMFFTRDIPRGIHDLVKDIATKRSITYNEAQDYLQSEGAAALEVEQPEDTSLIAVAERSSLDIFLEDVRRTLRFYTKNSKQSHFSALYLSGGGGNVKGLKEYMEENLQIKSQVMDPLANLETKDKISIEDPAQYAVATGLAVRKGFEA